MFDVISYDEHGNEDKAMAKKLKDGFAKVYDNMCKDCLGTGKKEINFIDPATNVIKKTIYLKCNCEEAA
jgi:hypothetical protein